MSLDVSETLVAPAHAEADGSWRTDQLLGVVALWFIPVVGFVLALVVCWSHSSATGGGKAPGT